MNNPFETQPLQEGRIKWAISQSMSMTQASKIIGCSYTTFKKYAKLYGLWKPNQSGKGIRKPKNKFKHQTDPMKFWKTDEELEEFKKDLMESFS